MTHPLASINITPGEHKIVWHAFGMTFYGDTIISTLIAGAIVILLGFFMRSRLNVRKPGRVQLFYETVTDQVQKQVDLHSGGLCFSRVKISESLRPGSASGAFSSVRLVLELFPHTYRISTRRGDSLVSIPLSLEITAEICPVSILQLLNS